MPALPNVPDVTRAVINGTVSGQDTATIFHILTSIASPTSADEDDLAQAVYTAWYTNVLPLQHESWHLLSCETADLTSPTSAVGSFTADNPGVMTGVATPSSVALVASWPIPRRYRGGHPRTYMPGVPAQELDDERHVTTGYLASFVAAWAAFRTDLQGLVFGTCGTVGLVCVHYVSGGTPLVTPTVDIIGVPTANARLDSQRRRFGIT